MLEGQAFLILFHKTHSYITWSIFLIHVPLFVHLQVLIYKAEANLATTLLIGQSQMVTIKAWHWLVNMYWQVRDRPIISVFTYTCSLVYSTISLIGRNTKGYETEHTAQNVTSERKLSTKQQKFGISPK